MRTRRVRAVLSSSLNVNGPYGTTVERIFELLDAAGFNVELVTGYETTA